MFYNARLSVLNILLDMSRVPNECLYGCFASVSPLLDKVHVWDWSVWGTWCIFVIHEGLWCAHINCLWAFIGAYRNLDLTNYFWASFLNAFKNSNIMCDEEIGAPVDTLMWWGIWLQLHKHSAVMWYTWPGALTPYGIPFELLLPHRYLTPRYCRPFELCILFMVFFSERAPEIRYAQDSLLVLKSNGGKKLGNHSCW